MKSRGFVTMDVNNASCIAGANTLLDNYYDFVTRAQMGLDSLARIVFAQTTVPVTPALPRLSGVVGGAPLQLTGDLRPEILRDGEGVPSIGVWRAQYTATGAFTYNTLGLLSSSGLLVAALSVGDTTIGASDVISVQWTIAARGQL